MIYTLLENRDLYTKNRRLGSLHVVDAALIEADGEWRHKRRFLDHYELIYVVGGALHLRASDQRIRLGENRLLVLPPFRYIEGFAPDCGGASFYLVDFQTDIGAVLPAPGCVLSVPEPERIRPLFPALTEAHSLRANAPDIASATLLVILHEACKNRTGSPRSGSVLQQILSYVEAHIRQPLTLASVAEALNYNKDYVNRVFKRSCGSTLKKFINHRKMEAARTLLRTSSCSVDEIAEMLGFSDGNLFTKFFIYHQHVPPSVFRGAGSPSDPDSPEPRAEEEDL